MPAIIGVLPNEVGGMVVVQVLCEDSIAGAFLDFPAVLQRAESLRQRASAADQQAALRVCGLFRDDVDDAVHRVRPPYSSARPTYHFDPLNVLQRHVLRVPINTAIDRGINGPA